MATTRGERLRIAREKRFKSARLAGKAMNVPVSTYGAHERAQSPGGRDYGPEDAKKYARRFGVTPEWLLTGREPFATVDGVRMSKKKMFFRSTRAVEELGYAPRPARHALTDAIAWFKANGYIL